jgi:ribosomal protein L13E
MSVRHYKRPVRFEEREQESSHRLRTRIVTDAGFSILELHRAGLSESRAHALGLPVDGTRHSALRHNISHLKSFAG